MKVVLIKVLEKCLIRKLDK